MPTRSLFGQPIDWPPAEDRRGRGRSAPPSASKKRSIEQVQDAFARAGARMGAVDAVLREQMEAIAQASAEEASRTRQDAEDRQAKVTEVLNIKPIPSVVDLGKATGRFLEGAKKNQKAVFSLMEREIAFIAAIDRSADALAEMTSNSGLADVKAMKEMASNIFMLAFAEMLLKHAKVSTPASTQSLHIIAQNLFGTGKQESFSPMLMRRALQDVISANGKGGTQRTPIASGEEEGPKGGPPLGYYAGRYQG